MDKKVFEWFLRDNHLTHVYSGKVKVVSMRAAKAKARRHVRQYFHNQGGTHYKIGPWAVEAGEHRAIVRDPSIECWVNNDEDIRYTLWVREVQDV